MKKIIFVLALVCLLLVSGCNPHSADWDRTGCLLAGYEMPVDFSMGNIVRCRDGEIEVGIHYKEIERLRGNSCYKVNIAYEKDLSSPCKPQVDWCRWCEPE